MKICQWSDLHLEWQKSAPTWPNSGADVLILGGDICLAEHIWRNPSDIKPGVIQKDDRIHDARRYREFFRHVNDQFKHVIYVAGNHEHYEGRWDRTIQVLTEEAARYPNIHFLEQGKVVIDGVVFLGASLWTNMNREDPITMMSVRDLMNDYKAVADFSTGSWDRLRPHTTVAKHRETLQWLRLMLNEDKSKTVVVTHYAPSYQSIHETYKGQWITNGAFASDLDEFIIEHPHIALWTHGHVHNRFDYMIDSTRVVCNPHGYPGENTEFDPNLIIEV